MGETRREEVAWASPGNGRSSLGRDTETMLSAIENLSANMSVSLRDGVERRPAAALGPRFRCWVHPRRRAHATAREFSLMAAAGPRASSRAPSPRRVGSFARGQTEAT